MEDIDGQYFTPNNSVTVKKISPSLLTCSCLHNEQALHNEGTTFPGAPLPKITNKSLTTWPGACGYLKII